MKRAIFVALCALSLSCAAHDDETPIRTSAELRDWCRMETEAYSVGKGEKPMNWTASYTEQGNAFHVSGKWRVASRDVEVECRAARGAQRRYATFTVKDG